VAKKLDRTYLGFELSAEYAQHNNERLEEVQVGQPLQGAANPLTSAPSTDRGRKLREPPAAESPATEPGQTQLELL
jgi:site-specific DNA-methyltransferase (adenine-specific)